jgi:two-component system, cell cycle response regulator DivK
MSAKKKILVVEDNELNLKLFTDLLEASDYEVIQDKDGQNVMQLCAREKPDLILMDIQLPNISGIDLIERLKIDEIFRKIPIVAVTAFTMQDDRVNILNSGADEYISKPISITNFISVMKKFLGQ